jgi:AraC-like DNA-binding protein
MLTILPESPSLAEVQSRYVEYAPTSAPIAAVAACTWIGETGDDAGYVDRVLPDACIDVIWDGARMFVAGPDTGPVITEPHRGSVLVGLRFRPGRAPGVLGVPANEILDQRVDIADLWGERIAARLRDDVAGHAPADVRRALEQRVAAAATTEDAARSDGVLRLATRGEVSELAGELGVTTRTLHRQCVHDFGYGAKTLQQVLRFRRFLSHAEQERNATMAALAAAAGYADQSHLVRDCRRLAGLTPSELLVNRRVRSVQDDEPDARAS